MVSSVSLNTIDGCPPSDLYLVVYFAAWSGVFLSRSWAGSALGSGGTLMQADLRSGPARLPPRFCGTLGISSLPKVQYNEKMPISHLCQGETSWERQLRGSHAGSCSRSCCCLCLGAVPETQTFPSDTEGPSPPLLPTHPFYSNDLGHTPPLQRLCRAKLNWNLWPGVMAASPQGAFDGGRLVCSAAKRFPSSTLPSRPHRLAWGPVRAGTGREWGPVGSHLLVVR